MDVGNKTLSQLSDLHKEKQYVSLETGAKVSGYTRDYLEHLCRLNKVDYRLWNNGQFVIELESLLTETHTILLSYDDVTFVPKEELEDDTPQVVMNILTSQSSGAKTRDNASALLDEVSEKLKQKVEDGITQAVPTFGGASQSGNRSENAHAISRVGRSVISDPLHTEAILEALPDAPRAISESSPEEDVAVSPAHAPIHIPINAFVSEKSSPTPEAVRSPMHIKVQGENAPVAVPQKPPQIVSPFHPIQTSVDATPHHDDAPLFPLIQKITEDTPSSFPVAEKVDHPLPVVPRADDNSRVVVFSQGTTSKDGATQLATKTEMAIGETFDKEILHEDLLAPTKPWPRATASRASMLPGALREEHLMVREPHALMRSPGFNIAFVACLAFAALSVGGLFSAPSRSDLVNNIASVASSLPFQSGDEEKGDGYLADSGAETLSSEEYLLPFSDDVLISTSTTPNTVVVQPVFDGVPGRRFEYVLTPRDDSRPSAMTE